jgi:glycerol-1-phosphate dehydrogenase [NAD(P)+]
VHTTPDIKVVIGGSAIDALGTFLEERSWPRTLVVSDANTHDVLGGTVERAIKSRGQVADRLTFELDAGLVADEGAVARLRAQIVKGGPDVVIVAGSGTLTDITRYATFSEGKPFISLPTAASMDGYASGIAAMQFDGLKASFSTHAPVAIFADLDIVASAPTEMTRWGLGDLLGKATAHFDWWLAHVATGEVFCPAIAAQVRGPLNRCLDEPEHLLRGGAAGIEALLEGLIGSGLAMARIGSSRPASGSEHHMSHFWDLLAYQGRQPHRPHGLQVGYGTRLAMSLQRRALEHLEAAMVTEIGKAATEDERYWLGTQTGSKAMEDVRAEKRALYAKHAASWPPPPDRFQGDHLGLDKLLETFPRVEGALSAAGMGRAQDLFDAATVSATMRFANRVRSRFTTLDLLESQGVLASVASEVLQEI